MPRFEPPPSFYNPYAIAFDDVVGIALLAEFQVRKAIARGDFDDLPGAGKPFDLPENHDPDWWLKNLLKRENLTLLPSSIQLRKDDAALDDVLDEFVSESDVRRAIELFNERVIHARYELPQGPPLITMPRDVEETVDAWAARRRERIREAENHQSTPVGTSRRRLLPRFGRRRRPS